MCQILVKIMEEICDFIKTIFFELVNCLRAINFGFWNALFCICKNRFLSVLLNYLQNFVISEVDFLA